MFAEVVAVVLAGVVIAAYFERASLKADAVKVEVASKAYFSAVVRGLRTKFNEDVSKVREQVAKDVAVVIGDVKAWEAKETVSAKEVIAQVEARIKQIL
jgi:hypothetical protein